MSFTFNWNGFNVPQAQKQEYSQRSIDAAGMLGKAAAGYERNRANQEYSDIISGYSSGSRGETYDKLVARLRELEARNAEIAARIQV